MIKRNTDLIMITTQRVDDFSGFLVTGRELNFIVPHVCNNYKGPPNSFILKVNLALKLRYIPCG